MITSCRQTNVQAAMEAWQQEREAEYQAALRAAQERLDHRCASFVYQLQSAISESTAAAEEHAAHSLQGLRQRIDDLQARHTAVRRVAACARC